MCRTEKKTLISDSGIEPAKKIQSSKQTIAFVKAGKPKPSASASAGILASARDWQRIANTTLRPDVVLVSESTKQVLLLELTVPWEDHLEDASRRRLTKFDGLISDYRQGSWRARCLPTEVAGTLQLDLCSEPLAYKGKIGEEPSAAPPMPQRPSQGCCGSRKMGAE